MTRKRSSENDIAMSGAGAAAPVRRKATARPRGKRAPEASETLAPPAPKQETVAPAAGFTGSEPVPTREEIARLAYLYWEARGCQGGCPEEDWLRAEQELRNCSASAATA